LTRKHGAALRRYNAASGSRVSEARQGRHNVAQRDTALGDELLCWGSPARGDIGYFLCGMSPLTGLRSTGFASTHGFAVGQTMAALKGLARQEYVTECASIRIAWNTKIALPPFRIQIRHQEG
jgi:hypothetical protein